MENMERTLAMIKPSAVARRLIGKIIERIEEKNLKITAMKMLHMTKAQAEGFYAVHKGKPFYEGLTEFKSSGPVVVMVLEGENAISRYRDLMGDTDLKKAAEGTIRRDFALDIRKNSVHGSDSSGAAAFEIEYFFNNFEIMF
jgi:nucleoside-diphosphate kinase